MLLLLQLRFLRKEVLYRPSHVHTNHLLFMILKSLNKLESLDSVVVSVQFHMINTLQVPANLPRSSQYM
jgi:hypothetical protein